MYIQIVNLAAKQLWTRLHDFPVQMDATVVIVRSRLSLHTFKGEWWPSG
jgi:hypothetical protein